MGTDVSKLPTVTLRPLTTADFGNLVHWINTPHVARWWDGSTNLEAVETKYGPRLAPGSASRVFIIEVDDFPIGFVQCYRHKDYPDWDRAVGIANGAGIDYVIGESEFISKGIGGRAIRKMVDIAFALYPEIDFVLAVPQKGNRASWRALEKAGFLKVDERKLESDCPSDAGVSVIYAISRSRNTTDALSAKNFNVPGAP